MMDSALRVEHATAGRLRPWQRLAVRLAVIFTTLTLLTVGVVGGLVHQRQSREVEDTLGTQLLNIARVAALMVEPAAHARAAGAGGARTEAWGDIARALKTVQDETLLTTPMRTLTDFDAAARRARIVVTTADDEQPGQRVALAPEVANPVAWTFEDGVARYTGIHRVGGALRISAFAPILDAAGATAAVLQVDYPVDFYFDRLRELDTTIAYGMLAGTLLAIVLAVLVARHLTRPIVALTAAAGRVAAGDLSQALEIQSRDEVGQLTRAFNHMVEGLRQRDFIRSAFGRYVSPEVARTLLESPDGLRLGGHKREITVLMSDLRGYTRFAEHGDPEGVVAVLNEYLGRMADIVIAHGGTINEFIGDAIFAVFGAPVEHADHAERAAAAALAMQRAMGEVNAANAARGRPRFDMGIGLHTGEAVVGNIGSEQRAKYAVVGAAVNRAARVEGCTVGGQILITAETRARLDSLAETAPPISVELKGLDAPVLLHELRGLRGRFAQRLDDEAAGDVAVELPLVGWLVEDKRVHATSFAGTVRRLGRRHLEAVLPVALAPLSNVRLRVAWPGGAESGDIYGKVTAGTGESVRIHLTSIDPGDAGVLETLIGTPTPETA